MRGVRRALTATPLLVLLGACGGDGTGGIDDDDQTSDVVQVATTEAPPDITAGKDWGARETQAERGTLIKEIGDWAGLNDGEGRSVAVFRVTDIVPDLQCTGEAAREPVNGTFVGLMLDVETSGELGEGGSRATFTLAPENFVAIDAQGDRDGRLLGEARQCLPREDYLPDAIGASKKAQGMVVLDVPVGTEVVMLDGQTFRADNSWEWALP